MRPQIIQTIFFKELREMLRDRRSMLLTFGLPLVLYPLVTLGIAGLGASKHKEYVETKLKVAVVNAQDAPELLRELKHDPGVELAPTADYRERLRRDELDAAIVVPEHAEEDALSAKDMNLGVELDQSRSSGSVVESRVDQLLDGYGQWIIEQRLAEHGAPVNLLKGPTRKITDVATADQRLASKLVLLLPMLLLMTGMLGALFPALNATTTERELGTLEALLVTPASRMELLLAKGMLVLFSGLLTAGLNMFSMALVLWRVAGMISTEAHGATAMVFHVDFAALLVAYLASAPALLFFTTLTLIVGLIARNFREANAFATPVMLLPLASALVAIADPASTTKLLITPVVGTTLMIRDVLLHHATLEEFGLVVGSSLVYAALALAVAARVFTTEQLVNPAWEPLSIKGLGLRGKKKRRRLPQIDEAFALYACSILLVLYVSPSFMGWAERLNDPAAPLLVQLYGNELLLIALPALGFAYLGRWKWAETFSLRRPRWNQWIGGVLMACGMVLFVELLQYVQQLVWPEDPASDQLQMKFFLPAIQSHPVVTILSAAVLAGVCEEWLYRGPILSALLKKLKPATAIILTSLVFAAAHLDLHHLVILALLALAFGWMVYRGGSIFPAMLAHGVYDGLQLFKEYWATRGQTLDDVLAAANHAPPPPAAGDIGLYALGAALFAAGVYTFRWRTPAGEKSQSPAIPSTPSGPMPLASAAKRA